MKQEILLLLPEVHVIERHVNRHITKLSFQPTHHAMRLWAVLCGCSLNGMLSAKPVLPVMAPLRGTDAVSLTSNDCKSGSHVLGFVLPNVELQLSGPCLSAFWTGVKLHSHASAGIS